MFITSSKSYAARRADGTLYRIPRGFVGNIPDDIAESDIVKLALKDGSIVTPETKKDKDIDKALVAGEANAKEIQAEAEAKAEAEDAAEPEAEPEKEPEAEPEAKPAKKGKTKK